ncbi:uncharacterized protein VTP21DRAFT_3636 [Calcarisporiella thermophila]|uniref:uncharacterized protein n=1 Tax=Calcarisporiella thermophila TaxID=911321 RepID=UPI003742E544
MSRSLHRYSSLPSAIRSQTSPKIHRLQPSFNARLLSSAPPAPEEPAKPKPPPRFGVPIKPSVDERSVFERVRSRITEPYTREKNLETREYLMKKLDESYFKDITELRKHGGKMWEAQTKLIRAEKALYMPNIKGTSLDKRQTNLVDLISGKTSLVAFSFVQHGSDQLKSFIEPFVKEFRGKQNIELVELNIQENPLKSMLVRLLIPNIRHNIPTDRHSNYIIHYGNIERLRDALGMTNTLLGYVFLVDNECRIRWAAHGIATEQELQSMRLMTRALHDRNTKKGT